MSVERNANNLPKVKPFLEVFDPAFDKEGLITKGMPGAKRAIARSIALLEADSSKNKADQNLSGSPKESSNPVNKIRAIRTAVGLINESNPNQITKEEVRDMITTVVLEGSQGIPSINYCIEPENQLLVSRREIAKAMRKTRETQLVQLQKTKENDTVPELDTKQ